MGFVYDRRSGLCIGRVINKRYFEGDAHTGWVRDGSVTNLLGVHRFWLAPLAW